eukprot:TRINITY_DN73920_c0_g1_i1.p1 TRINITY_DN73920_c0_g1~~TRINITY_DN73920_c0_g1_i1.p1  ORF type:complete len:400 (+),score=57.28 TRINITY_DN73920_c0_g1_i1:78-1277(+)
MEGACEDRCLIDEAETAGFMIEDQPLPASSSAFPGGRLAIIWAASVMLAGAAGTFMANSFAIPKDRVQVAQAKAPESLKTRQAKDAQPSFYSIYSDGLKDARYIDLTHAFSPDIPVWDGFGPAAVKPTIAGGDMDGFIGKGEEFSYLKHGFVATSYHLTTDQLGTQLDPPAHWNEYGATISDLPPTFSLRPLVVISIVEQVRAKPDYMLTVKDIHQWEATHGRIPKGSAVFVRSDWSLKWREYEKKGMLAAFPGVSLDALKFFHHEREILFHGHEPLDTDTTPNLEGEAWLMHNNFAQAEGVANLHMVPEFGCLLSVGFAKALGGSGGYARYVAICPPGSTVHGVTVRDAPGAPLPRQKYPLRRGANGVLTPTEGASDTKYCSHAGALGCDSDGKPVWS